MPDVQRPSSILATYSLQILCPELTEVEVRFSLDDKRVLANLPAMLEAIEEDLSSLLPEGYSAKFTEEGSPP